MVKLRLHRVNIIMNQHCLFAIFLAGISATSTTLSGNDVSEMYKSFATLAPRQGSASRFREETENDLASMYGRLAGQPTPNFASVSVIAEEEQGFDGASFQSMIDSVFLEATDEDMLFNLMDRVSREVIIRKAGMLLEAGHKTIALAETMMDRTWEDKDEVAEDSQDGSDESPVGSDTSQVSETEVESQTEDAVLDDATAASMICEDYKNGIIKHDVFNILKKLQLDDDSIQDILAFYTQDIMNIVEREEGGDSEGLPETFVEAFKGYANALNLNKSLDSQLASIQSAFKEISGDVDSNT